MKIAGRIAKHGSNPPAGHSSNIFFLSKKGVHMKQTDVAEGVTTGIEQILYERWRHEGYIECWNAQQISFTVDGRRYLLQLEEEEPCK